MRVLIIVALFTLMCVYIVGGLGGGSPRRKEKE